MRSFTYGVPLGPTNPNPAPKRRGPRLVALVAACAVLGGLVWSGNQNAVAGSGLSLPLGWMLGRPAIADERARQAGTLQAEGERMLAAAEYAGAQKRFAEALRLDPTRVVAYDRAALARYLQNDRRPITAAELVPDARTRAQLLVALSARDLARGRVSSARPAVDEAVAIAPNDPQAQAALGACLEAADDTEGAAAAFNRAAELAPDDLAVAAARFDFRVRRGEAGAACAERIALLQPRAAREAEPAVRVGLLEAYLLQGLAPEEVRRRLSKDVPSATPAERELLLGEAYLRHYRRNPNWHREAFERVLDAAAQITRPDADTSVAQRQAAASLLLEAHHARSQRFLDRSDVEAARLEIESALRQAPDLPGESARFANLQAERARLLTQAGKTAEASRALEAAIRLQPDHPCRAELAQIQAGLGMTLLSAARTTAAIGHFRRAVSLSPEDDGLLARYYQVLPDTDRISAVAACAAAANITDPGRALARLAHGFSQAQKPVEAQALLKLAEQAHVAPAQLAVVRAEASRAAGQRTLARDGLLQALEREPTPELWLRLGAVEAQLAEAKGAKGDQAARTEHLALAIDAYQHAIATQPDGEGAAKALAATRALVEQLLKRNMVQAAERRAAEGRVLAPTDPQLSLLHAEALGRMGRDEDQRSACAAGLAGITSPADTRTAALHLRHGQVLRKLKRPAEAVETLKAGLAEEVAAPPARCADLWYELAFAHVDAQQREEALNAARQYAFWSQHDLRQKQRVPAIQALELGLEHS